MSAAAPSTKRMRTSEENGGEQTDKDALIANLQARLESLEHQLHILKDHDTTYFASAAHVISREKLRHIPPHGTPARHVKEALMQYEELDFKPRLNTSSYVNVVVEPEERDVAIMGLTTNLADASVYPASVKIHDTVVNMLAKLWHAPPPTDGIDYCGSGTVGSTEACLLAGLALKFRWREWYQKTKSISKQEAEATRPNIVISTMYQAAWEKFFRYFDVDPKFVKPNMLQAKGTLDAKAMADSCDERTIAVVCILGNHYNGSYDPVWDVDREVKRMNAERGFQVGIHIDGASGAFVAPFQNTTESGGPVPAWDFRLDSVLSISASGHKFGESICGTGWLVFRHREELAEHIAVSVTYLGGHCDSMTLNFSRPASAAYVQLYKLLRLGMEGYESKVKNQMMVCTYMRDFLRNLKCPISGLPRFQILDGEGHACLPVVSARLNPELGLKYNDIDLQHAMAESHWYVSAYELGFENFANGAEMESLVSDLGKETTMFRIVCKSNLTMGLAEDLMESVAEVLPILDSMQEGYASMRSKAAEIREERNKVAQMGDVAVSTALAATKWLNTIRGEAGAPSSPQMKRGKHKRRRSIHAAC